MMMSAKKRSSSPSPVRRSTRKRRPPPPPTSSSSLSLVVAPVNPYSHFTYSALHRLYNEVVVVMNERQEQTTKRERKRAHDIQQAYLANRERAMPTECYQIVASFLDRQSRTRLAQCDRHQRDQVIYGPNSGVFVWRYGIDETYARSYFYDHDDRLVTTTGLAHASALGNGKIVRILLKARANTEACSDYNGRTALFNACDAQHLAVVDMLVAAGASVNVRDQKNQSPLYLASYFGFTPVVQRLLAAGALTDEDDNAPRPLWVACSNNHSDTVAELLKANADVNSANTDGWTALMWAAANNACEVIKLLLTTTNTTATTAVRIDDRNADGDTALMCACTAQKKAAIRTLLQCKANPNIADNEGRTTLLVACMEGHESIVRLLLLPSDGDGDGGGGSGCDVNIRDHNGHCALMIACMSRDKKLVKLLLKEGKADPNVQDNDGRTPLIHVCETGHTNVVRLLLAANADTSLCDKTGTTALMMRRRQSDRIATLLINASAKQQRQHPPE